MTYDEYWHKCPSLARAYRKANEIRMKQEEWARWRSGAYIYNALLMVSPVMRASFSKSRPEPGKYPEEPWPLTKEEAKQREEAHEKQNYEKFAALIETENKRE